MNGIDFSKYASNGKFYSGAERKKGILINGESYIVKYAKESEDGLTFSHVSEYLGSHLFNYVGVEAQQTLLGTCDGKPVVVMKDFLEQNETFVPFNDVGDSSLEQDREKYQYAYDSIIDMLKDNTKLTNVNETCDRFWDMYIIDAWIGNFDRHGANWGFIKKDNRYRLSPVYDNGSSLFPRLNSDEKLQSVLASKEEMDKRVFQFPTSQILLNGKKSSYYEIINSLEYEECNKALMRMNKRINMTGVEAIIECVEGLSDIRRQFYKEMLQLRYEKLLMEPYRRITGE